MMQKNNAFARIFNVLVYLFLYLPIVVLIVFSFNDSKSRTVWAGFSLHWYQELFRDEEILSAFSTTITVSVLAAVIATVLGTAAAIFTFIAVMLKKIKISLSIEGIDDEIIEEENEDITLTIEDDAVTEDEDVLIEEEIETLLEEDSEEI